MGCSPAAAARHLNVFQLVGDIWVSDPSPASSSIILTRQDSQISPTFFMDHRPAEWTDLPLIAVCSQNNTSPVHSEVTAFHICSNLKMHLVI